MHILMYTSCLLTASAAYLPPRAVDPCIQEAQDYEAVQLDGITADGTAGIGAEFESPGFYFTNKDCSIEDTNAAKKEIIDQRTGTNWELTADSTSDQGKVNAEYILDGQKIKVGSGDGAAAAKAWADDLVAWKPWTLQPPNVNIANSKCNPWKIATNVKQDPNKLPWAPQVTAPMPLEALYSLMVENEKEKTDNSITKNILDGTNFNPNNILVVVTQEYFQSNPNKIDKSKMTDDVLAFCSLVLSYAKAASNTLVGNQSPKLFTVFMPRTEFITLFGIVKSKLPGDLFKLFDNLACYKTDNGNIVVDTDYCSGPSTAPISNNKFSGLKYSNAAANQPVTVNIKDWITDIGTGSGKGNPPVDALSDFDRSIDTSIGGLTKQMEKMYKSERSVPLFEFRNLDTIVTSGAQQFMTDVDSSIQSLHSKFSDAPTKRKRDAPSSCIRPFAADATDSVATAATTPSPPVVVAPVDPPSQPSCVPAPTGDVKDAHEGELQKAATFFCTEYADSTVPNGPINIANTIIAGDRNLGRATIDMAYDYPPNMGNQDDVYQFTVTSVPDCTPDGGFNLATPVANNQCADILHNAWKICNNQGRGGSITAGCLVYSVTTQY